MRWEHRRDRHIEQNRTGTNLNALKKANHNALKEQDVHPDRITHMKNFGNSNYLE
jgi:hypothetical protein